MQKLQRQWVVQPVEPCATATSPNAIASTLRILQWNLLADGLAQHGDFVHVDPTFLEWQHRKPLILAELEESAADVICLQELNHFEELQDALAPLGYEGAFLAKSHSPATKYQRPADGVAIFWRASRLAPRQPATGFHFQGAGGETCAQGALHVSLQEKKGAGRSLLVATTHLKAKEGPGLDELRLAQMQQLLAALDDTLQQCQQPSAAGRSSNNGASLPPPHVPIVVTGDFNATPDSLPCQFLASHPLGFTSVWNANVPSRHGAGRGHSNNGFGTKEAHGGVNDRKRGSGSNGSRPTTGSGPSPATEFSTWKIRSTGESKRTIDHMWWAPGTLQGVSDGGGLALVNRWRMLTESEIGERGLPCEGYPSDHIALCSEFTWR